MEKLMIKFYPFIKRLLDFPLNKIKNSLDKF